MTALLIEGSTKLLLVSMSFTITENPLELVYSFTFVYEETGLPNLAKRTKLFITLFRLKSGYISPNL